MIQTRVNMSMVNAKLQQGHPRQILVITTPRMHVMDIRSVNTSMVYANQRVHQGHPGHQGLAAQSYDSTICTTMPGCELDQLV